MKVGLKKLEASHDRKVKHDLRFEDLVTFCFILSVSHFPILHFEDAIRRSLFCLHQFRSLQPSEV